jgi:hypothetical protein
MSATSIVLLAAALAQEPEVAPRAPAAPRHALLEGVAVHAGEELVTLSEFERRLRRTQELEPPEEREDERRQYQRALLELWTARLEAQKGADLGLDPSQIARISRANLEAERERTGLTNYLAELRAAGKDALLEESERQQEVLGAMWQYKALGNAFAGYRATRDATIRPGELRDIFEENREELAPTTVELRLLVLRSESHGGTEATRALCEDARRRVEAGEDLALLVEELGDSLRAERGLIEARPVASFAEPLASFARNAEIGALSAVQPLRNPKTGEPKPELGFQLIQLHDRHVPPEPDFDAPEVQRKLRIYFTRERRERVLERARQRLHREAYAWVNPLVGGGQAEPGP